MSDAGAATRTARTERGQHGQASVEVVALVPVVVGVVLTLLQVLAAGAAGEHAGHAAEAGAVALLQRTDPRAAARAALPDWEAGRMRVRVRGDEVSVRVRPRTLVPGLAGLLEHTARARAGAGS